MRSRLLAVAILGWSLLATTATAQGGILQGLVKDKDSGEELIAVDVILIGTGLATQTDLEGRYRFADLAPGTYSVRASYIGYDTKVIPDVEVAAGQTRTLDITLASFRANAIDDVMVTATRVLSTESAVLADRKNAAVVGDAISAAQISRSPDSQAGDALKRVTGLMVDSGGYVNVRGMPDRYNVTVVDGAVTTSVDPDLDRKSFNFEMIPANLLSSLQVLKTALPDMPGDFTGGYVKVNTVEFPEAATTRISVSGSLDLDSAGDTFYRDAFSGDTDWLGIDGGERDRPQVLVDAGPRPDDSIPYPDHVARALPNRWDVESATTPLPFSLSVSHGNRFRPLGRKLGVIGSVSYKTSSSINNEYKALNPQEFFDSTDYLTEVNLGALLNLNLELAENQTLSFKNLYGRNTEESFLRAYKGGQNLNSYRQVLEWEEKDQLTSSLSGSHALPVRGLELGWRLFYNENKAKEPDLRFIEYNLDADPLRLRASRRHWLDIDEFRRGLDGSLAWSVGDVDRPTRFSLGLALSERERGIKNNPYTMEGLDPNDALGGLVFLPPGEIFAPENFKETLFTLRYQDQFEGAYEAMQVMNAYYAMADVPFELWQEEFRLAGGARVENHQLAVDAFDKFENIYLPSSSRATNVLPSVNLAYEYDEKTNVRLAYYRSVNYPEIREIADVQTSDFKNDWEVAGNDTLEVATIDNFDLRIEHFPKFGEVFAVSFFYKDLQNAIETSLTSQANYLDRVSWFNGNGTNYGIELEARTRLDFLGQAFYDFTITGNYTRVWSEVDTRVQANPDEPDESARIVVTTRQLQGQAPWLVNLNLKWESLELGSSATILFNRVGRRLDKVAPEFLPQENIYEEPRNLLDAAFTQQLSERATFKLTAKNILGADRTYVFHVDENINGEQLPLKEYGSRSQSPSVSASLSVKF